MSAPPPPSLNHRVQALARPLRRPLARVALRCAQTAVGGRLAGLVCAHAPALLPVERVAETDGALVFRHPVPEAPGHLVIVPKTALRDLCALVAAGRVDTALALIAAARLAPPARDGGERVLTVNVGARQQVAQLHAHLLPVAAAQLLLGQVRHRVAVDLASPDALYAALTDAASRLDGCAPGLHGSLVLRGFDAHEPVECLVCIAPRDATQ